MTRLHDPVDVEGAALYLGIIDLLVEMQRVKEGVETAVICHHKREEPRVLRPILYRHLLGEDVLEILVRLMAGSKHVKQYLWGYVKLPVSPDRVKDGLCVQPGHEEV